MSNQLTDGDRLKAELYATDFVNGFSCLDLPDEVTAQFDDVRARLGVELAVEWVQLLAAEVRRMTDKVMEARNNA